MKIGQELHLAQVVQLDIQVLHELHNMAPGLLFPCTHRGWLSTKHLPTTLPAFNTHHRGVPECQVPCSPLTLYLDMLSFFRVRWMMYGRLPGPAERVTSVKASSAPRLMKLMALSALPRI